MDNATTHSGSTSMASCASQGIPPVESFLDEKKALSCIHCGLCLSSCPTYLETGNENLSPRGRIYRMRAIQSGRLGLSDDVIRPLDLCLGCRACETACPSGVPYGDLLEHTRDHIESHHERPWMQMLLRRFAIEQVFPYPERMELAMLPTYWLRQRAIRPWLPTWVQGLLELLPDATKSKALPLFSPAVRQPSRGVVGFFQGCVMSVLFSPTHRNSIRLLNEAGYDVHLPPEQGCCGALSAHGGSLEAARRWARQNIEVFEKNRYSAVVINAAGCGSTLKEYAQLLQEDSAWVARATRFSEKVKDLSEILLEHLPTWESLAQRRNDSPKVTFHDACHLAHAQRITQPPRLLVQATCGGRYVEMKEADVCCGSAGSYNLTEPEMAERLQQRKVANVVDTQAHLVVTTNPGCLLQIQAGLRRMGSTHVRAMHLADYLAERCLD